MEQILARGIREGSLEVALPGGGRLRFGDETGPYVAIRLKTRLWAARIAADPEMAVGEAYMAGALTMERGDIYDLLDLAGSNLRHNKGRQARLNAGAMIGRRRATPAARRGATSAITTRCRSSSIAASSTTTSNYSCAYFDRPGLTLDAAQRAKQRHLAAKLLLEPGQTVLDIGCGWGGLSMFLAARSDVRVEGVTLSEQQAAVARWRAEAAGLSERVSFSVTDYRDVEGPYDRIVSVGMFEHVGRLNYRAYFDQVARLLAADGVAVIHSIGRFSGPGVTQPWLAATFFRAATFRPCRRCWRR